MPKQNRGYYDHIIKIVLIGDSGVGKTSLLHRFADDHFNASFVTTIGVDFKIKTLDIDGTRVKLQVWDTAGQERFRSITTAYYRGAHAALILYDITDRQSFDNIGNWLKQIPSEVNLLRTLVGTKTDLSDARTVDPESARAFAYANDMDWIETSSKMNENIQKVFVDVARRAVIQLMHDPSVQEEVRLRRGMRVEHMSKTKGGCCAGIDWNFWTKEEEKKEHAPPVRPPRVAAPVEPIKRFVAVPPPAAVEEDEDTKKFREWMTNVVRLPRYTQGLIDNGFDDMSVIPAITENDLIASGITKVGHRKRIMLYVQRVSQEEAPEAPAPVVPPPPVAVAPGVPVAAAAVGVGAPVDAPPVVEDDAGKDEAMTVNLIDHTEREYGERNEGQEVSPALVDAN